jgi:hypothetical protein
LFCAPGHVFSGTESAGSRLNVLRSQTRFRRHRGRRVKFSSFALPDTFLAVSMASSPVFMFCAPGLILGSIDGVESHFHILRSQIRLGMY